MGQKEKVRAALISVASNTLLTSAKLLVGIMMQSVSVIAEAIHSGLDLLASGIALISVRESGKPADDTHRFGHGQFESLSGLAEALLILVATGFIISEAVKRLLSEETHVVEVGIGAGVMLVSAVMNYLVSRHLFKVAKESESLALEADALHLSTDVYTSAGVFAGLLLIHFTGLQILDPIVALAVAVLILKAAVELAWRALKNLVDVRLPDEEESIIHDVLRENSNAFLEVHKLRTRMSGPVRQIDMHLVMSRGITLEEAHRISHILVTQIHERLRNSEVLIHIEPCHLYCEECHAQCEPEAGKKDQTD